MHLIVTNSARNIAQNYHDLNRLPSIRGRQVLLTAGCTVDVLRDGTPLRLEFPRALDHVTSRGNARQPIVKIDEHQRSWQGRMLGC